MKRLTISIEENQYERLRVVSLTKDQGRISKTIRNILNEVLTLENKAMESVLENDRVSPKKVTVKEFEKEVTTLEKKRGELRAEDYV